MAIVTDITPQKKPHYFNIFVDSAFFCSLSELQLSHAGLRIGEEVSQEKLNTLLSHSKLSKAYNRAIFYLKYGPRTESQMQKYLLAKDYELQYVEAAIARLKEDGYIHETRLAELLVEELITRKSKRQIHVKLLQKGFQKETIEQALAQIDGSSQIESIRSIATKKLRNTTQIDKQKLMQYLMRQGFLYSDICVVLDELVFGEQESYNNTNNY